MNVNPPDALVGAVALEYILLKFKPQLEDDADFRGAFHVLSGFSAEQLTGDSLTRVFPLVPVRPVFLFNSLSLSCDLTVWARSTRLLIPR
jgi:hypothetical protein